MSDAGAAPDGDGEAPIQDAASDGPIIAVCATEAWSTYGHDAQRTFASQGCVSPQAKVTWQYAPSAPTGRTYEASYRVVAGSDGAYLGWMASDSPYTGTTALDRVSVDGARVWTWDSGTDTNLGNWPSIGSNYVAVTDDGLYFLDPVNGKVLSSGGVDWWGQSIPDANQIYMANQMQADGPGLFVGAMSTSSKAVWQQSSFKGCGHSWGDQMGGLALDNGILFYAPAYSSDATKTPNPVSGMYAFDSASGTPKWKVTTTPASALSASGGLLYTIEAPGRLVARKQSDGSVAWSQALVPDGGFRQIGSQAPVLVNGMAIVATSDGIFSFNASNGTPGWTSPVVAPAYASPSIVTNGCGGNVPDGGARQTTMAAATASGVLVVTAADGIHFLALATGNAEALLTDSSVTGAHDPVVVGKRLYVVNAKGLVALE